MTVRFTRTLEEMRPVLMDPNSYGPDPVYVVHQDLGNQWINMTKLMPGNYSGEYPKTFGHYHADGKDEIYHIESGEGLLFLQSDKEISLVRVKAGQEVKILKEYAHAWINIGPDPLVSYDDHKDPQDNYQPIAEKHGLAYYIVSDNGQPKAVPNPNYPNPPEPKWLTAEELP
jgi:oxalate decarboxylase/phosphoglucose isomerase-like protein (cupin superfamily)